MSQYKDECWMDIQGYESFYRISDYGRVYSKIRKRIMKPFPNPKGYLLIELQSKTMQVHRLVMTHFKSQEDMAIKQVNHKDSNKKNNHLSNLEWVTNLENQRHSWENGRQAVKGSKQGSAKLNEKQAREIKDLLADNKDNLSHTAIARMYGVSRSTITNINRGKVWNHV